MVEESNYFDLGNGSRAWRPCHLGKGLKIGEQVSIGALSHIGNQVEIGKNSRVQGSVYIADQTIIGNSCFLGPGAVITNDKYPPSNGKWSPIIMRYIERRLSTGRSLVSYPNGQLVISWGEFQITVYVYN